MTLATIADIAAECGVCPVTIRSRLNNANVRPAEPRREDIERMAREWEPWEALKQEN